MTLRRERDPTARSRARAGAPRPRARRRPRSGPAVPAMPEPSPAIAGPRARAAVVGHAHEDLLALARDGDRAALRLAVAQQVGGRLADERAEQRLQVGGDLARGAGHGGLDARGAQDADGVLELGGQVGAAVALHQRARLAQRGAGQLLRVGGVAARGVVVHADQPAGELGLQRDRLEVMALHVVQLAGEAQPLAQDRQLRRGAAGLVEAQRHVPDPDRREDDPRARGDHHAAHDRQPDGLPGALVGEARRPPRPRRTARRRPRPAAGARARRCRSPHRWPPSRTGAPRPATRRSTTQTAPHSASPAAAAAAARTTPGRRRSSPAIPASTSRHCSIPTATSTTPVASLTTSSRSRTTSSTAGSSTGSAAIAASDHCVYRRSEPSGTSAAALPASRTCTGAPL